MYLTAVGAWTVNLLQIIVFATGHVATAAATALAGGMMTPGAAGVPRPYLETYPIGQPSVGATWTLYANADPAMIDSTVVPATVNV
jgi:hypothetical protein